MSARKSERLLNLLITLLVSRGYVDKQRLREVIPDYREARSDEAFEKMFERDKEDLRSIGVPIEMGSFDAYFDDEQGYRIPRAGFELPQVDLSADEAAVVGLAARVWQQAGLATATSDALLKLKAAGVQVDREALDVLQPQMTPDEPAFACFWEAVTTRCEIAFDYRSSTQAQPAPRRLQPWGILSYRARWYAVGHDVDRQAARMFRLSRVVGDPALVGEPGAFSVPEGTDLRALAERLAPDVPDREATLRVRSGHAVALRHRAEQASPLDEGWERMQVRFGRLDRFVDEVVALGADVVVEEPADLRVAVVRRLRAVLEATA